MNARVQKTLLASHRPVTLIGGGAVDPDDIDLALRHAPDLVAADGGADIAMAAGHMPKLVVGDLDSVSQSALDQMPPEAVFEMTDQDSTDFDKALSSISAPVVLAIGFGGARLDHQLATLNALIRLHDRPCILITQDELVFSIPRIFSLKLEPGDVVSLFPLSRVSGRSKGLQWPIDGLVLAPDGRVGTSNRATGEIQLRLDRTGLIGIIPRHALQPLMRALAGKPL
ncbi:MAG: thiamine diphosphokinase [Rhodobacteraceae bacterium]|nr:thiamine diphosphokinase [Paracoccaceae bacterium]